MSSNVVAALFEKDQGFLPSAFSMTVIYVAVLIPLCMVSGAIFLIFLGTFTQAEIEAPAGCRLLGMHRKTHLDDEFDEKYSQGTEDRRSWKVKSIWIYPVKSCKGVELEQADVISTGLEYDRHFSFAQLHSPFPLSEKDSKAKQADHQWRFLTQRENRMLSQVKTELWIPDPKKPSYKEDLPYVRTGGALIISFPWQEPGWKGLLAKYAAKIYSSVPEKSFIVPFNPTPEQLKRDYPEENFTIWKDTVKATNMGLEVPRELRSFLGVRNPITLFRVRKEREIYRTAPRKEQLGWQPITGFADAFPMHIIGIGSVQELSSKQPEGSATLSSMRFRPNVVFQGPSPYAEDQWKKIRIGTSAFYVACRCVRCTVPNINPMTGAKHNSEPAKTMKQIRNVDPGAPNAGCLGVNLVPEDQKASVKVGDLIEVLETGEHVYISI